MTVKDGRIDDVEPLGSRARENVCKDIQAWLIHPLASTFSAIFTLAMILTLEMNEILGYISTSSSSLVTLSTRVVASRNEFYARNCESSWSKELSLYGRRDLGFSFFLLVLIDPGSSWQPIFPCSLFPLLLHQLRLTWQP